MDLVFMLFSNRHGPKATAKGAIGLTKVCASVKTRDVVDGYPAADYSKDTLREVQQQLEDAQYRCFLLDRARDGLSLAKEWEKLPAPKPLKKWDWVIKNWRTPTKVSTTPVNLASEARGWPSQLGNASYVEKQFLKASRAPAKALMLQMGEVADDHKDQSLYAKWLSAGATPQDRKWRLVASVLLWTASRE